MIGRRDAKGVTVHKRSFRCLSVGIIRAIAMFAKRSHNKNAAPLDGAAYQLNESEVREPL